MGRSDKSYAELGPRQRALCPHSETEHLLLAFSAHPAHASPTPLTLYLCQCLSFPVVLPSWRHTCQTWQVSRWEGKGRETCHIVSRAVAVDRLVNQNWQWYYYLSGVHSLSLRRLSATCCQSYTLTDTFNPYGYTAIKHYVADWVKPSFVIFDIQALWRSALSVRVPGCQKLQIMA